MAARPRGHMTLLVLACLVCALLRLAHGQRSAATTSGTPKPQIRIAHMISETDQFASVRYLVKYMNTANRTLLPDFDIVVDEYKFRHSDARARCAVSGCQGGHIGTVAEELIRIFSDDTPTYHGISGPYFLPEEEVLTIIDQTASARVIHVHGADYPILSDRIRYPYSFRQARSLEALPSVYFHLCSLNEWRQLVTIWPAVDLLEASLVAAKRQNITTHTQLGKDDDSDLVTDAWQLATVDLIRRLRIRVVVTYINQDRGTRLICRLYNEKLSGIQFFTDPMWALGWWFYDRHGCTGAELTIASAGNLHAGHILIAPGVDLPPSVYYAEIVESQKDVPLGCMPDITPDIFYNSGELLEMGKEERWLTSETAQLWMLLGASRAVESICSILLAIHNAIYDKNASISSIESRDTTTFNLLVDSMMAVDFQAPSGHFRYYNNTGDPEHAYYIVTQYNVPGKPIDYGFAIAGMLFPDGRAGEPALRMADGANRPLVWPDGSTGMDPKPHLALFPDCRPVNGVLIWEACQPCPAGTFYEAELLTCRTCPAGQFQNETGKSKCELAPLGSYIANVMDPAASPLCPAGHECPQAGTVSSQPCAAGRYAEVAGSSSCALCPKGRYQNKTGATECVSCAGVLMGAITATIASTSPSQCICPEGTFRNVNADFCSSCLEGLECPEGSDIANLHALDEQLVEGGALDSLNQLPFPKAVRGYMTIPSAPLKVYRCVEEEHCPGGAPGSCAARRDPFTVACGNCLRGSYENGEDCIECGSQGAAPLLLTGVFGIVLVSMATLVVNKDVHKTPAASMMIMSVSGLLLFNLQTMGIFSALDVPWEEPVKTFLRLAQTLSFDLRVLQAGCVVGVNPIGTFTLRQSIAVFVIPVVGLTILVKKHCGRPKTRALVELCNSLGSLYSVFFISIVISAMEPFMCYRHPNDNGESVQSASSLLCFEGGEHASMATTGAIALFIIPVPYLCVCMYGIMIYPKKMKLHSSSQFLHAARFLFFRYVPERYYFQMIVLLRSLMLCIIPAVMRDGLATQVLCISTVLVGYGMAVLGFRPWRIDNCNILDCLLTNLLVLLMVIGALFIKETPQKEVLTILSTLLLALILVGFVVPLFYGLYLRFAPQYFNFFICHHKSHAAAQARYIKVLLLKKRRALQVFIDSDNLKEMDTLFDIVKSRVRHVIVLLTADTLTRPWCVGEVVAAVKGQIAITRLVSSSFAGLTDAQIRYPQMYVDSTGCNLREYGIQWEDVTQSFNLFFSSASKQLELLDSLQGTGRFEHAIAGILNLKEYDFKARSVSEIPDGSVVVVTDPRSDEATAAAGILADRIAPEVFRILEPGIHLLCNYRHSTEAAVDAVQNASASVMILSPGCLQSLTFVRIICGSMPAYSDGPALISLNIQGFSFPTPTAIENLCKELCAPSDVGECHSTTEAMTSFFKRISLLYPTHASQETLNTQSDEIFRRIKQNRLSQNSRTRSVLPEEPPCRCKEEEPAKGGGAPQLVQLPPCVISI